MSFRKSRYKDKEKWRVVVTRYTRNYYQKTANYKKRSWTKEEDELVLSHKMPDRELSSLISRSMKSIVMRRHVLKNKMNEASGGNNEV